MERQKIKIDILPNQFLKPNGIFDKESAIRFCGKIAGVCYDKEGFSHLENEDEEKTMRRVSLTLNNGHHSVYDHVFINFNLHNIPKILAMVLNNEHQYTTSEKSARYTPIIRTNGTVITSKEESLYHKWIEIFKKQIKIEYANVYNDSKIQKLAQENARYLVTVFMPTEMIYSTTLRQINYIVSWMRNYIEEHKNILSTDFETKLSAYMMDFIEELDRLNVLEDGLLSNEKSRSLSLFGKNLGIKEEYFGDVYSTIYKSSFSALGQAHRHRTLDYQIQLLDEKEYFIPPIIKENKTKVDEWLADITSVQNLTPQGELVLVNEMGKYEDFILKCKERLCSAAQLEIMLQTKETLLKYKTSLENNGSLLADDIIKYIHGARCTFADFHCASDCKFIEGKTLERKI